MMEKRKAASADDSAGRKKRKVGHTKQKPGIKSQTEHSERKQAKASSSPKASDGKKNSGLPKTAPNFWWHSKKVKKLEKDRNLATERDKPPKDEGASKSAKLRGDQRDPVISKKKMLQLKKKRQRKNRLLRKKETLNKDSEDDALRKPTTLQSKVSGKDIGAKKKSASIKKTSQVEKGIRENKVDKSQKDLQASKEALGLSRASNPTIAPPPQGTSQSPVLQKQGGQKARKRERAKKFKQGKIAGGGSPAVTGDKMAQSPTNSDGARIGSVQEQSGGLNGGENGPKSKEKIGQMEAGPRSKEDVSANWKAMLQIVEKSKETSAKRRAKSGKGGKRDAQPKPSKPVIWFDDVDPSLIKANENAAEDDSDVQSETGYNPLIRKDAQDCLTKCLAMDCEMVGTGPRGSQSALARVSVVNQYGACVLDKYVTQREPVTDYRTFVSGIRPRDLRDKGEDFAKVQKELSDMLKGRIVVGHALHNDFKVLYFSHPRSLIRDTSSYRPFKELFKSKRPGLKKLTELVLKVKVQKGEHNSVEDAQAAMKLYMLHRKQWEKSLRDKSHHQPSNKRMPKVLTKNTPSGVPA